MYKRQLLALTNAPDGRAISTDEMFRLGWPDQKIDVAAARNRVRVALSRMRASGLGPFFERSDAGVRLCTNVHVRVDE